MALELELRPSETTGKPMQLRIHVPNEGLNSMGETVALEGPAQIRLDPGTEAAATVTVDPEDPSAVIVRSLLTPENDPGNPPYAVTFALGKDARAGKGEKFIFAHSQVMIYGPKGEAVSMELTADEPTEIPEATAPPESATELRRRQGRA